MESLHRSLIILATFLVSVSDSIAHPRHHQHKHAPRQGAFAGTQIISSPDGRNPTNVLLSISLESGSLMTTIHTPAPTTDPSVNPTEADATTRTFPTTILQVPVATICPTNASIPVPIPYTVSPINLTGLFNNTNSARPMLNTTSSPTNATEYLPIPANISIASPTVTLPDPNARIILGDNGCQTFFTPITTAICSTVLSIGGQVPISVTDCGEWVTFSSSPDCGAAGTPAPAEAMVYFLAPWYEIASGAVPAKVQVQTCSTAVPNVSDSCMISSESWSMSTKAIPHTAVQTARFVGGAVGVSSFLLRIQPVLSHAGIHKLTCLLPHTAAKPNPDPQPPYHFRSLHQRLHHHPLNQHHHHKRLSPSCSNNNTHGSQRASQEYHHCHPSNASDNDVPARSGDISHYRDGYGYGSEDDDEPGRRARRESSTQIRGTDGVNPNQIKECFHRDRTVPRKALATELEGSGFTFSLRFLPMSLNEGVHYTLAYPIPVSCSTRSKNTPYIYLRLLHSYTIYPSPSQMDAGH